MNIPIIRLLLPLVITLLTLNACIKGGDNTMSASSVPAESGNDLTVDGERYADSILNCLTLEQRVGQCFMPSIYASHDSSTLNRFRKYFSDLHVGGIVLLKGDLYSAAILSEEGNRGEAPMFIAMDAEWGLGMRLTDAPGFPRNGRLGPAADEALLFEYGSEVARECRRVGINMVLGPVVDVVENPEGIIGSRSFGGDPVRVANLGIAYARGLESGRVISVAKHFPGHGSPSEDSHHTLPVIKRTLNQLDSVDLYPFRRYIESGLTGIMVGHLAVPAVDPDNLPAAVSYPVIHDLLREELEFKGLVLTDALNMGGAEGYDAIAALRAGADIIVSPADTEKEIRKVIEEIRSGNLPVSIINDRCRRILFHKYLIKDDDRRNIAYDRLLEDVYFGTDSLRRKLKR